MTNNLSSIALSSTFSYALLIGTIRASYGISSFNIPSTNVISIQMTINVISNTALTGILTIFN